MSVKPRKRHSPHLDDSILAWLLDSDASIRWQVLRDLTDASQEEITAERKNIPTQGWGKQLLDLQKPDGAWEGDWDASMHSLSLLREMGLDPSCDEAQHMLALVREQVTWRGWDLDGNWRGREYKGNPFFAGEAEPCVNGQVGSSGAYFRQNIQRIIDRLLGEQLPNGGWNCEASNGSIRASFNTTICVLEALLEYERSFGAAPEITAAREGGQDYLLERRLFHRLSTGEVIKDRKAGGADWTCFAFPVWWHYDVLRGLEYLRLAAVKPDERLIEAISLVESKRDKNGRWRLEVRHAGSMPIDFGECVDEPSRWITLRALRVLDWYYSATSRE